MKQNKYKYYNFKYLFMVVFLSLVLLSCIDENQSIIGINDNIEFKASSLILQQLEGSDDFINSPENPPLISAEELHDSPTNFIVIDIRTPLEFSLGRIPNSVNVSHENLIDYISKIDSNSSKKVILVSTTGQYAAFCCSLLRLNGYKNIYSLNFGISIWHSDFSTYWNNATKDQNESFNLGTEVRAQNYSLPNLYTSEPDDTYLLIQQKTDSLLKSSFDEKESQLSETELSITFASIYEDYYKKIPNVRKKNALEYTLDTAKAYLICYGEEDLYYIDEIRKPKFTQQTVFYNIDVATRSSEMMYNIPPNKTIFIYSYSGQRSAILTAYLSLLGYNAKSISFGANNMIYSILKSDSNQNTFTKDKIMNYKYEKD